MSDIEYSVITNDAIKSFDCIKMKFIKFSCYLSVFTLKDIYLSKVLASHVCFTRMSAKL